MLVYCLPFASHFQILDNVYPLVEICQEFNRFLSISVFNLIVKI